MIFQRFRQTGSLVGFVVASLAGGLWFKIPCMATKWVTLLALNLGWDIISLVAGSSRPLCKPLKLYKP